jgi:hypothetical protein
MLAARERTAVIASTRALEAPPLVRQEEHIKSNRKCNSRDTTRAIAGTVQ